MLSIVQLFLTLAYDEGFPTEIGTRVASSAGFTVLFLRTSGRMGRERGQGDELLRMLSCAYKSNLCSGKWGNFERQKPFIVTYNSLFVFRKENGVKKRIKDIPSSKPSRTSK